MKNVLHHFTKSTDEVVTASRSWAAATSQALAELFAPVLREGERLPDLAFLQELCARVLELRWQRLSAADDTLAEAVRRHRDLLADRGEATDALYRELADLRGFLRCLFGHHGAADLTALSGETSRDPVALLRQAERAHGRLVDASRPMPPLVFRRLEHRWPEDKQRTWASPLARKSTALRDVSTSVSSAAKKVDGARAERRQALAAFKDAFVEIAGWLAATYRLAGRPRWALAVEPSRRRKGRLRRELTRRRAGGGSTAAGPRRALVLAPEVCAAEERVDEEQDLHRVVASTG